jgi:hypothetical protein
MAIQSEGRGHHRVSWVDEFGVDRSRVFRRKRDAEVFNRATEQIRAEEREEGHSTQPETFDVNHPEAHWVVVHQLEELLSAIYPDHRFTMSLDDDEAEQLPLNGSVSWEAQSKADEELERRNRARRFKELGKRHPEILGSQGEIDFDREDAIAAAIKAEPDLFPPL